MLRICKPLESVETLRLLSVRSGWRMQKGLRESSSRGSDGGSWLGLTVAASRGYITPFGSVGKVPSEPNWLRLNSFSAPVTSTDLVSSYGPRIQLFPSSIPQRYQYNRAYTIAPSRVRCSQSARRVRRPRSQTDSSGLWRSRCSHQREKRWTS